MSQENNAPSYNQLVIANGRTGDQWIAMLQSDEARDAKKALNYFDGQQKKEMVAFLNGNAGRRNWENNGLVPRFRNLVSMIVEKSGMLFKDQPPNYSVIQNGTDVADPEQTQKLLDEIAKLPWQEFFTNFDQVIRLLKTAILLIQYDKDAEEIVLDILHRGNCNVIINPMNRQIQAMIYTTSDDGIVSTYRIFNDEEIIDLMQESDKQNKITVTDRQPNPWKSVPAVAFYDTKIPRNGFWVEASHDLIDLNEMYNLHITDSEWVASWIKRPTLFTSVPFEETDGDMASGSQVAAIYGSPLPRQLPQSQQVQGGPGKAVTLNAQGIDHVVFDYKAPVVDMKNLNDMFETWAQMYAQDWSVKLATNNHPSRSVTSGFALLIEEIDNLDLRKRRQRQMEGGFKRFFEVLRSVMNTAYGTQVFSDDSELVVEFGDPYLPVDDASQEQLWQVRIDGGRATELDYFVETQGMSEQEAMTKYVEMLKFNAMKPMLQEIANGKAQSEMIELGVDVANPKGELDGDNDDEPSPVDGEDAADILDRENQARSNGIALKTYPGITGPAGL